MRKESVITLLCVIAFGIIIFLGIKFHSLNTRYKNIQNLNESIVSERFKELATGKETAEKKVLKYNDSILVLNKSIEVLEKKRKSNAIYYQNEIEKLKKVTTYHYRQSYADSLSRTMR